MFVLLCQLNSAAEAEERSENIIHRKNCTFGFLLDSVIIDWRKKKIDFDGFTQVFDF